LNILVDNAIFTMQQNGGISRLWRSLLPALQRALPEAIFAPTQPPDWFISTYYRPAPSGVRSLAMVYDCIPFKYPLIPNRADRADIRRAVAEATVVVSISRQTAADVQYILRRDSVVAYPGVEADFGKVLPSEVERFQAFVGRPYMLMVGRRGLYKNAQAVYQAWGLWSGAQDYKLLCVGGEDNLPQDVAFANRYPGTWQRVVLSDADLRAAYAGATALIYPSLMEGFGLPVIEAMACGCPVICDHTLHEVAGGAALYADMTRPRQIASALNAVLDMSARMERVLAGLDWARRYTWTGMAEQIAGVLKEV
jgi:glycosyltransferase involved in cell wall biosynthesis